jgi:ABC-2 type transport system permease protein
MLNKIWDILKLIQNENIKVFFRIKTLFFCLILILAICISGTRVYNQEKLMTDWKYDLKNQISQINTQNQNIQKDLNKETDPKIIKAYTDGISNNNNQLLLLKYALDNNIPYNVTTVWRFIESISWIIYWIAIFVLVQTSNSVSFEYTNGTMKQILIRPFKRWKILLSKYLSVLFNIICLFLLIFLAAFIIGSILFKSNGFGGYDIILSNGSLVKVSLIMITLKKYTINLIVLILLASFAFMISTVSKSNSLALTLSLLLLFSGRIIPSFVEKFFWCKYFLAFDFGLDQLILNSDNGLKNVSLQFLSFSFAVYLIVFLSISYTMFSKRDVL